MTVPAITLTYLVPLAALFAVYALIVVILRNKRRTPYGDGGDATLNRAIRVHGNFAEWVPMLVLVIGELEVSGAPATQVQILLVAVLIARIAHAVGLFQPVGTPLYLVGRIVGALTSWLVLIAATVLLAIQVY